MRITQQHLIIQQQNKSTGNKTAPQMKAGAVLNGKIIEIQGNALTIALANGGTLLAQANDVERFFVNENIAFEVTDAETDVVKVALLNDKSVEVIKEQLQTLSMDTNEENIKAFEVLKSLNIPVTKENMVKLTSDLKHLNVLFDTIKEMPEGKPMTEMNQLAKALGFEDNKAFLNSDLKTLVVQLLSKETIEIPMDKSVMNQPQVPQDSTQSLVSDTGKENAAPQVQEATLVTEKTSESNLSTLIKDVLGLKVSDQLKPEVEHTLEKLGQLLKLEKPVTLNNLQILNALFESEKIDDQVKSLLPLLEEEVPKGKLLSLLKGLDLQQVEKKDQVVDYFRSLLDELKNVEKEVSQKTQDQVVKLQDSVKFMQKENNDFTWIQVPIQLNQETKHFDVMIKSKEASKNKYSKDQAKILIALDTHYLKKVQSLIEVNKKTLTIDFKVENENIKKVFDKNIATLAGYFEDYFDSIQIRVNVDKKESFRSFLEEDGSSYLNLKV